MTKQEIIDILIDDAEYTQEDVDKMDNFELFHAWCIWEGIIGYSMNLWSTVIELYKDELYKNK